MAASTAAYTKLLQKHRSLIAPEVAEYREHNKTDKVFQKRADVIDTLFENREAILKRSKERLKKKKPQ